METALCIAIQAGVPVLIWGAPGVGKTSATYSLAEGLDRHMETIIASIREPSDFSGLPVIRESGVIMEAPAWAKRLVESQNGILFIDEITTAPPAVQAALLRVVLDRVVGDLTLPDSVSIIAAANPPEQAAGGWDLSAPLANRFCHLHWSLDPRKWIDGMLQGWATPNVVKLPENWEAKIPVSQTLVASFIRHRPHLLLQVPESESQAGKAWSSPRSWDMASRLIAACEATNMSEDVVVSLIAGCIGEGPAMEFLGWKRDLDLPDPEEILADPKSFRMPERGDRAFAILTAVVSTALLNLTKERWLAAWQVLARAAEQGGKDVAAVSAKALAQARKPELPLPKEELKEFIPLLQKSGMM